MNLGGGGQPIKPTLPVWVDCEPYRAKLSIVRCVERWAEASREGKWKTGSQDAGASTRGLKQSHCRFCAVGERRAGELEARPELANIRFGDLPFNLAIDRESAPHPQAGSPFPLEAVMKTCPSCGAKKERFRKDSGFCLACDPPNNCNRNKRGDAPTLEEVREILDDEEADELEEEEGTDEEEVGSPPVKRHTIVPPAPRSPFHTWLALHDVLDERKRVAAASIRAAEEEIAKFEVEHPGLREDAAAKLRGLMGSTPVVLPPVKAVEA